MKLIHQVVKEIWVFKKKFNKKHLDMDADVGTDADADTGATTIALSALLTGQLIRSPYIHTNFFHLHALCFASFYLCQFSAITQAFSLSKITFHTQTALQEHSNLCKETGKTECDTRIHPF